MKTMFVIAALVIVCTCLVGPFGILIGFVGGVIGTSLARA